MRLGISFFSICLFLFSGAGRAADFDLTTPLLRAEPGSWIRRYEPHGHVITQMVVAVDGEEVVLRRLRHRDGHVLSDDTRTFSAGYIRENGADPDSPDARREWIEHNGGMYDAAVVEADVNGRPAVFYITDAIPAGGLLRVDLLRASGEAKITLWTDDYGIEPDELIRMAVEK